MDHDDDHLSIESSDADLSELSVVLTVIDTRERQPSKDERRFREPDTVLGTVMPILVIVPFEFQRNEPFSGKLINIYKVYILHSCLSNKNARLNKRQSWTLLHRVSEENYFPRLSLSHAAQ